MRRTEWRRSRLRQDALPRGASVSWPTIGYMEDFTAAWYEDVVEFFKRYYQPSNATLVVAGDIQTTTARAAGREVVFGREGRNGSRPPIDYPHAS